MTIVYVAVKHQLKKQARHKKQDEDIAEVTYIFTISTGNNGNKSKRNIYPITIIDAHRA